MNKLTSALALVATFTLLSASSMTIANQTNPTIEANTNLRLGSISATDELKTHTKGSAIGGKFELSLPLTNHIRIGSAVYATQALFDDSNHEFFGSVGQSYAILGQAYLQASLGRTQVKVGRFELDSPHVDTDDIRMIPNTFAGIELINTDIDDTTIVVAHITQWAGVDSDKPEHFTEINNGIDLVGAVYEGVKNTAVQAWYYRQVDYADLVYVEGALQLDNLDIGIQVSVQSDNSNDNSGPSGKALGVRASYTYHELVLSTAYNKVNGIVVNGFGGGPFFTSSEDHTIEGERDQTGLSFGVEYTGIENMTLGVFNVNFYRGKDEIDYYLNYIIGEKASFDLVYHDMHDDGNAVRMIFNYSF